MFAVATRQRVPSAVKMMRVDTTQSGKKKPYFPVIKCSHLNGKIINSSPRRQPAQCRRQAPVPGAFSGPGGCRTGTNLGVVTVATSSNRDGSPLSPKPVQTQQQSHRSSCGHMQSRVHPVLKTRSHRASCTVRTPSTSSDADFPAPPGRHSHTWPPDRRGVCSRDEPLCFCT